MKLKQAKDYLNIVHHLGGFKPHESENWEN